MNLNINMRIYLGVLFSCVIFFGLGGSALAAEDIFIGPEFYTRTDAYAILDVEDGSVLLGKNAYQPRPIASLTKLMTAMVALDHDFDFSDSVTYDSKKHYAYRNYMNFRNGDVVANRDLWVSMLMGSMNVPARMIVDSLGMSEVEFVGAMNDKVVELGLHDVHFVDPHGLSPDNIGSAVSVGKLLRASLAYPQISQALSLKAYSFNEVVSSDRRYAHNFRHSNRLHRKKMYIPLGPSKTGYLWEAGNCLAFETTLHNEDRIVVTLGEESWYRRHEDGNRLAVWWDNLSLAQKSRSDAFLVKYPNDPRVFEVVNGTKSWIPDAETFLNKGYRWDQIMTVSPDDRIKLGIRTVLQVATRFGI